MAASRAKRIKKRVGKISVKDLYIIGAGSVGGHIAMNFSDYDIPYHLVGFFDDDPQKIGQLFCGYPVLGAIDQLISYEQVAVVIGIAFPQVKKKIFKRLSKNGSLEYPSLVSSRAWVSAGVSLGKGIIIYPGTSVNYGTVIDDYVVINMNCAIGHDCKIGAFSSFAPGVNLGGNTALGVGVDMGIGAATKQFIQIGDGAIIGGQSMVIRDVIKQHTIVGVPGKRKV